jgi:hypothetical protein
MAARRRKQIAVCRNCSAVIWKYTLLKSNTVFGEPYDAKVSRTVRERG